MNSFVGVMWLMDIAELQPTLESVHRALRPIWTEVPGSVSPSLNERVRSNVSARHADRGVRRPHA